LLTFVCSALPSLLAAFGEVKKRVRTTAGGSTGSVRNLRIREDTAKYLLNLDANSAYYDPKSRSMREDPNPNKPDTEKTFRGDNFIRTSGEVQAWQALNLHSMQAFEKGQEVHVQVSGVAWGLRSLWGLQGGPCCC
jgi:pre-mRNA-processing factor SLU7